MRERKIYREEEKKLLLFRKKNHKESVLTFWEFPRSTKKIRLTLLIFMKIFRCTQWEFETNKFWIEIFLLLTGSQASLVLQSKEKNSFHLFIEKFSRKILLACRQNIFFLLQISSLNEKCHLKYLSVNIKPIPTNASVVLRKDSMECSQ